MTSGPHVTETVRSLYACAADSEVSLPEYPLVPELRAELRRMADSEPEGTLETLMSRVSNWVSEQHRRFSSLSEVAQAQNDEDVLARRAVLACAPISRMSGSWLQWLSEPGNADDPIVMLILKLYALDLGVGRPRASRGDAYLPIMRHYGVSGNAMSAERLASDRRLRDIHFRLPALLLTLSRRPSEFTAEILGADLCMRSVGLLPALRMVRALTPHAIEWDVIDPSTSGLGMESDSTEICCLAIKNYIECRGNEASERVLQGFRATLALLRIWTDGLHAELEAVLDPAYEMAELMRLRAREGQIYHETFLLAGRPLSVWLAECRDDPYPMLEALAGSRLVRPGNPERSPLVCGLVSEGGRMFRVFSPEDLAVIRRWISALPTEGKWLPEKLSSRPDQTADEAEVGFTTQVQDSNKYRPPRDLREAYHCLLSRTVSPAVRRYAFEYVQVWLARSRQGLADAQMPLPRQWHAEGLRPWLIDMHDRHNRDFEESEDQELPSREELIDSTLQLSPLTLIDGAWLMGFTDYGHASSEIGHALFDTYWDELGNGEPPLNHPLIYREVLREMDIDLPPTSTREFAYWPAFRDSSFELPVYWLSIGRFPRTFMPEILGLNLAMELSGVGGSYRRARIALNQYGFSTHFVDIHNTIDNVATGHSAWAADAIDAYLSSLSSTQDEDSLKAAWDRVRVGYISLSPPVGARAKRSAMREVRRARSTPPEERKVFHV